MDIEEGGSWDPAFLVETSRDTSSVQTVTGAQEDELLMETGESGLGWRWWTPPLSTSPPHLRRREFLERKRKSPRPRRSPAQRPEDPTSKKLSESGKRGSGSRRDQRRRLGRRQVGLTQSQKTQLVMLRPQLHPIGVSDHSRMRRPETVFYVTVKGTAT